MPGPFGLSPGEPHRLMSFAQRLLAVKMPVKDAGWPHVESRIINYVNEAQIKLTMSDRSSSGYYTLNYLSAPA
jgi:hypothetical protein